MPQSGFVILENKTAFVLGQVLISNSDVTILITEDQPINMLESGFVIWKKTTQHLCLAKSWDKNNV